MSPELIAVIVGGVIGAVSSLATTLFLAVLEIRRRRASIRSVTIAEITAIEEKARRFVEGTSTGEELAASTPLLTSIAAELGHLSPNEATAFRRTVTLDMEMRKSLATTKAEATIAACEKARRIFGRNV